MPPVPRILHEEDVRAVVANEVAGDFAAKGSAVIASPSAQSATYVQAEATSLKTSIDQIRAALTAAGITA